MKGFREYYLGRSRREKALICAVGLLAAFVLFYYSYAIAPTGDREIENELRGKTILLRKFQGLLSREEIIKAELTNTSSWGGINLIKATHEGEVLTKIPTLLKKISAQSDLVLSKSNIVRKEVLCKDPLLLRLEIALGIEVIPKVEKLQKFIYQLEKNEDFTCYAKELKMSVVEGNQGVNLSAILETFAILER